MNVKVNSKTGQVAVARGTTPRADAVTLYNPGEYKINALKGQIAIPVGIGDSGIQYEIHTLTPEQASALFSPDQSVEAMGLRATNAALYSPGGGASNTMHGAASGARGFQQGATLNLSDEIGGAVTGAMGAIQGRQAPIDPEHPVTGGMSTGFKANYLDQVGQERDINKSAMESNPKIFKASRFAGSIFPSVAMPAGSFGAATGFGALQGAIQGAGGADTEELDQLLLQSALGAGGGAVGGAAGYGAGKLLSANTGSGMAYNAIDQASPSGIANLADDTARLGGAPAEQSPVLADTLRNFSEQAPKTAAEAIGPAQARMGAVNQQGKAAVDAFLSPENARILNDKISQLARVANEQNYEGAAYKNPAVVSLMKDILDNPAVQDALPAVQKLAAVQGRPDPLAVGFSTADLDALQRALGTMAKKAFDSTPENTLMGPSYSGFARDVNDLAVNMTPELGKAQADAAAALQAKEAIDLGKTALNVGRETADVLDEFNALSPEAQKAYLASVATKLRAALDSKKTSANAGAIFDVPGLADKLLGMGFPKAAVDKIVKGGMGARGVLDALQGGSDTAQKLLAAESGKSPLSKVKAQDLILAFLSNLSTMGGVKIANTMGGAAERNAAEQVVQALAGQGPEALQNLLRIAPQRFAPLLNIIGRSAGASQSSIFPGGGGQ